MKLKIHETTRTDGSLAPVVLVREDEALVLSLEEKRLPLPAGALDAVMRRYGRAVEPTEVLLDVARLDLGGGAVLRHVRHLARYDVIARDYLVYELPDLEPVCALAVSVAGALEHLGRAASRAVLG